MTLKKYLIICSTVIFFLFSGETFAQYDVEFNENRGSLTQSDNYKKDFGRYDGFEIPLYEGEAVNFVVYSDNFSPRLIFVSPNGDIFKQSLISQNKVSSLITTANKSGDWILYIIADSNSTGNYVFQYAIASKNSITLPTNSDFCTTLNFIVAHSKAHFLLMYFNEPGKSQLVKLNNSVDCFIDNSDGSYTAKMYEGNNLNEAEKIFKTYSNNVGKCIDKSWIKKSESWVNVEDYKVKSVLYSEPVKEKERLVLISLQDLSKSKQKFTGNYVVLITINRK